MRKLKCFINYDKEEQWLNSMAIKGYQLKDVSFGYKFHVKEPEDTIIRIDYRTFKNNKDFIDYCTLFEDSGWKHIAGTKSSGTQYFKKTNKSSEDDIFSDAASKAGKYKRVSDMWSTLAVCYFPIFLAMVNNKNIDINAMLNPKLLYYTPGLWESTGLQFWRKFLFETPFALMRGFAWVLFPIAIVLFLSFSIKARSMYHKQKI